MRDFYRYRFWMTPEGNIVVTRNACKCHPNDRLFYYSDRKVLSIGFYTDAGFLKFVRTRGYEELL